MYKIIIVEDHPMFRKSIGLLLEKEEVAKVIAAEEGIELTDKHWDVLNYLRDEYINNNGNQPMERIIQKAMAEKWGDKKLSSKDMYTLFPRAPSKQGLKVAGLPATNRKGGY